MRCLPTSTTGGGSPWERWSAAIAAEASGSSSQDLSLLARQVFNELRTDPSFSWLTAKITTMTQPTPFPSQASCCAPRTISSSPFSRRLAPLLYPTSIHLNTAHELLRTASPHLLENRLQAVLSIVVSLSKYQRATFLSVPDVCVGSPKSWAGDVSPGLLGLVIVAWIASRCCSLQDVVQSYEPLLRDILAAVTSPLVEQHSPPSASCDTTHDITGRQHVQRWAADRWLGRWGGVINHNTASPSMTMSAGPSLCVTPQRSGRATPVANEDVTPDATIVSGAVDMTTHHHDDDPLGIITPVVGGDELDLVGLPPLLSMSDDLHRTHGFLTGVEPTIIEPDDLDEEAIINALVNQQPVLPVASRCESRTAFLTEDVMQHISTVIVRQVMDVLLAHCPMPVVDHLVEDCLEDVVALKCCRSVGDMLEFEWMMIMAIARRWDIGVGGKFSGSYVSSAAASHFDATQWLVGSEGSDAGGNPSFVMRGIGSFATAASDEAARGAAPSPQSSNEKQRISFSSQAQARATQVEEAVAAAEIEISATLPNGKPSPNQNQSSSSLVIGTARHVVNSISLGALPQAQGQSSSRKYEVLLADGHVDSDTPSIPTENPVSPVEQRVQNEGRKGEKQLRRKSANSNKRFSLENDPNSSIAEGQGRTQMEDAGQECATNRSQSLPDQLDERGTDSTQPVCGGCCTMM